MLLKSPTTNSVAMAFCSRLPRGRSNTAVQSRKAVSADLLSKQILPFGFARQDTSVQMVKVNKTHMFFVIEITYKKLYL